MNLRIRTGVDLMRVARIERVMHKFGHRFINRIFTANEQAICGDRVLAYAARWAAKEAVAKLLGTGLQGIGSGSVALPWQSIEIQRNAQQKPLVCLHDRAADIARQHHVHHIDISLSHDGDYVVASAVALQFGDTEENLLC
ncbi:MAG: holo-ACP synthase [Roseiflexaceae bacterium]|jgi:holo-[acyl-carrier protein] synthase